MSAKTVMVQGTASSAGKSALVTALCRLYTRRGQRVAPFKAQNMALNSFVTPDGGEIGRSQAVQAEACGIVPSVSMNPILLKPTSDHKSQVVVNGRVHAVMTAREYYAFRHTLKPVVEKAFVALAKENDLVVIEGAGSPAEINLRENDLVNMGMASMAESPVILVGDIDRGGVFASLYGTVALLEPEERARIKGFVINKFRGDATILEPGLRQLEDLLRIPALGVLPYWDIRVEEEDSLAERLVSKSFLPGNHIDIAVVKLPRLANFTDFAVFDLFPGVFVRYVRPGEDLGRPDMVVVPGSKNTIHDMVALRECGMAESICAYHASGGVVAGICGGFQMLGGRIADPEGMESDLPEISGLGLIDAETIFASQKRTVQANGNLLTLPGVLASLSALPVSGYEIHMGRTCLGPDALPFIQLAEGETEGAVSAEGRVFGTYMHGFFDSFEVVRGLLNVLRARRNLPSEPERPDLPATYGAYRLTQYDRLADMLEAHLDTAALDRIITKGMG